MTGKTKNRENDGGKLEQMFAYYGECNWNIKMLPKFAVKCNSQVLCMTFARRGEKLIAGREESVISDQTLSCTLHCTGCSRKQNTWLTV